MKSNSSTCTTLLRSIVLGTVIAITLAAGVRAQEADDEKNLGQVQQGLVGGSLISAVDQERYGLVTLSTGCSGSLLRNNWVLTAAHCIDSPVPGMPGQFANVAETSVTLTAAWPVPQMKPSQRIISLRPLDIAIIRVATPFLVNGQPSNHNPEVFRSGDLKGRTIAVLGRGINQFASLGPGGPMRSQSDDQYRLGVFEVEGATEAAFSFPSLRGQSIAGGDSGGPSYVRDGGRFLLAGVHSNCGITCYPGQICGTWPGPGPAPANYSNWAWVTATPNCSDARVDAAWDEIDRYIGAFIPPAPPAQFIGRFSATPQNYQPIWVYAITDSGELKWFRKDSGTAGWQGPKTVGTGWIFKDVIAAGGNSLYALTEDGKLRWYRHDGFNDGSWNWHGPVEVGTGWTFKKIIPGGEGVIYAIREDGTLLWYKHTGYADGAFAWNGPKTVGTGWESFTDVFAGDQGALYAVKANGELLFYRHHGYATGEMSWSVPRVVGTGWGDFKQILPAGGGVILAIRYDGTLVWYRHHGTQESDRNTPIPQQWDNIVEIGTGWQGLRKAVALLPVVSAPVVH